MTNTTPGLELNCDDCTSQPKGCASCDNGINFFPHFDGAQKYCKCDEE